MVELADGTKRPATDAETEVYATHCRNRWGRGVGASERAQADKYRSVIADLTAKCAALEAERDALLAQLTHSTERS